MTFQSEPPVFTYGLLAAFTLVMGGVSVRKSKFHPAAARILLLFGICVAAWSGLLFGVQSGWPALAGQAAPLYGTVVLAWVVLGFTLVYQRAGRAWLAGWGALLLLAAGLIYLDCNRLRLPEIINLAPGSSIYRPAATWGLLLAGWIGLTLAGLFSTLARLRSTRQSFHRNRLQYLIPIQILFGLSAAAIFSRLYLFGYILVMLCAALMLFSAFTHPLPDLRKLARRFLSTALLMLASAALFAGGFWALEAGFSSLDTYRPIWSGAFMAAVLVLLFHPLSLLAGKLARRVLPGTEYQAAQIINDYALQISNIVDVDLLAAVAVGSVRKTLGIRSGHLLLVEKQESGAQLGYRLQDVPVQGQQAFDPATLSFKGPIAAYFLHEHRALTQYDLDLMVEFRSSPLSELKWFAASGMDVYLPVVMKDEWIGLIAFGPKSRGDRYEEEDLLLLQALATQTAAALENSRLVQNLRELNEQLSSAYAALNIANQQLERLDRTKTDFINIASHELRTPLTLLLGYAEMLAEDESLLRESFYAQMVDGICAGTRRLHEIVSSMLDMAKIDSRTLDLAPKEISLPGLIRAIQGSLEPVLQERNLNFEMEDVHGLPLIEADLEALQKVFEHLITNAVKFTPDGGRIRVIQQQLSAPESPLGRDSVEVVIQDSGIGINQDMQELIFVKFYQSGPVDLHSSGKTKFKGGGPGLGLAIVRGIVEAHNGRVWVESPGCDEQACPGSRFHVLLPLSQKKYAEPATIPAEKRQTCG